MQLGLSFMVPLGVVMKSHIFFSLLGVSSGNFTSLGRLRCMKRHDISASAGVLLVLSGSCSHPEWSAGDNPLAALPSA